MLPFIVYKQFVNSWYNLKEIQINNQDIKWLEKRTI